ncbi:putative ribonuclease H-like domain-containing protein [Tanacetum coccineum]|uniref:Ribonuclease H-like domain-containing protein n=1 Tax=Tanacetum coccineum TaxID=301880 RepID=A0ABQ5FTL1_9ASTR
MVKPVWNNAQRVNHQNFAKKTHPCAKKNLVPRAVLMKSGLVSINTARQNISKTAVLVNTARQVNVAHSKTTVNAARPMSYLSKTTHSTVKRPIHKNTTFKNSNINQRVNTVRGKKFNTARPKAVVNAVKGNNFNDKGLDTVRSVSIARTPPSKTGLLRGLNRTNMRALLVPYASLISRRTQKGNSCIEGTKLDRGYAGRAFTIQVTRSLDFSVVQGYTKEEGIDYDEVFAPVARIEAIRLFLAYASFKDFVVYQMDVKSAFLYGNIEEEVYVCQPPGFENPDFPDRVYKVEKHCMDYIKLLELDIIFGSTKKELCITLEKLMHKKFQMGSNGELTFFLGLQVKQKKDGIFISQDKYVTKILKKFRFTEVTTASTPMETQKPLLMDKDGEEVDVYMYRSMIGSLMYLISSRPDIMFAVCACVRYQVNPKVSHLQAVKRIFRYLKGQPKLGIWYPKDSLFDLVSYTDIDYARASLDRKSTT